MLHTDSNEDTDIDYPDTEYRVAFDGAFRVNDSETAPPESIAGKKALEKQLKKEVKVISQLQRQLYAQDRFAILMVFQAMDAAGKDGTIRAVMSGVNPAGCHVSSFKSPSNEELDHDFLWRTSCRLPERGRIGIFNRSYYEEVLAVRVHPEYLGGQRLDHVDQKTIWPNRFTSIREHEKHLARNGTIVLKFWLNVSYEEQKRRFLARLSDPAKYWKFSKSDLTSRGFWAEYMDAYQSALNETSTPWAPWYAIPADNKPFMRLEVARTLRQAMENLPLKWPEKTAEELALFDRHRAALSDD